MKKINDMNRRGNLWLYVPIVSLCLLFTISCEHDTIYSTDSSDRLYFSTDTVNFDTVFTTIGSSTIRVKMYNPNDEALRFNAFLSGDDNSPFYVNVDGQSGTQFEDLTLDSHDSLYVFVSVTIDPTNSEFPILVKDSLTISLENGIKQSIMFMAYGQNVNILRGLVIDSDTTFAPDLPILVYDSLVVSLGSTLTIRPGTSIYFHKGSGLSVSGRICARGTIDSMIVFRGDRTDRLFSYLPYNLISGQWTGIRLLESSFDNVFSYCDIHSADFGIIADTSVVYKNKMILTNSFVHNMTGNALELNNSTCEIVNTCITNAGGDCVSILGGNNSFMFCTIANFYPWGNHSAALSLRNSSDGKSFPIDRASFKNSIITGTHVNELLFLLNDSSVNQQNSASYEISYCMIKSNDTLNNNIINTVYEIYKKGQLSSENFAHISSEDYIFDFHLDSVSIARGIANISDAKLYPMDMDDVNRKLFDKVDAGCYQYIKK